MIVVKEIETLHHRVRCEHHVGDLVMKYRRNKADVKCYSVAGIIIGGKKVCRRHAAFILLEMALKGDL